MEQQVRKLLVDIRISCSEILDFTNELSYEDYENSRILQLAIEREFEIIGEALNRLERIDYENLLKNIPDYRRIIGLRNQIAHGYDSLYQN